MSCGTKSFKNYDTNNHPMCFELFLWILVIILCHFFCYFHDCWHVYNNFAMITHEMHVCGSIDFGFVCLRFLVKCFILQNIKNLIVWLCLWNYWLETLIWSWCILGIACKLKLLVCCSVIFGLCMIILTTCCSQYVGFYAWLVL
jgi:hypothetical protein